MYYRISTYNILSGKEQELIEGADRLRPDMAGIPGLKHIHAVKVSEDTYMTVAVYDSAQAADAATEPAKSLWTAMAQVVDLDSITQQTGEVIWEL